MKIFERLDASVSFSSEERMLIDAVRTSAVYLRERRFLCPSRDKNPIDAVVDTAAVVSNG